MWCRRIAALLCCLLPLIAVAQPANDDCSNASVVAIGNGGFALGAVSSTPNDISAATVQASESFAPSITVAGLNRKSMWYKFTLPTTRAVRLGLAQPGGGIRAGDVGFAVYKTAACLPGPGSISTQFSPIEIFGNTYHPCVDAGDYLVQVSSNNNANGPVFITLDISDTTGGLYDKPVNAYNFGAVPSTRLLTSQFMVQCQSIDDAGENCLPNTSFKDFTKSTWHTFTTPAYFDWLNVVLAGLGNSATPYTVGYRLYEGNVRTTPVASLAPVGSCDSFVTTGLTPDWKSYQCGELKPGTVYSVQLLFHKDFIRTMKLAIAWNGNGATTGPEPLNTLPVPNKMGTLQSNATGFANNAYDRFGCNSRHSQHNCPAVMPAAVPYNGVNYNVSSFFTFSLAGSSTIDVTATHHCGPALYMRLYKQAVTGDCKDLDPGNFIIDFADFSGQISCLEPGDYVLQVMGTDAAAPKTSITADSLLPASVYPLCLNGNMGNGFNLTILAKNEFSSKFSLTAPGRAEKINSNSAGIMLPLVFNTVYNCEADTFGCALNVMPENTPCGNYYKAIYRQFEVSDSMLLRIGTRTPFESKLYKGDADALATAQNAFSFPGLINGLTPYSKCLAYAGDKYACIVPGTYTLVSFDSRLGFKATMQIKGSRARPKFSDPALAQDMGSVLDSLDKYNTVVAAADTFTCYDNPAVIDGIDPCLDPWNGGTTKQIYRQFYLKEPARVNIFNKSSLAFYNAKSYSGQYTLFKGKATDGLQTLSRMGDRWKCFIDAATEPPCEKLDSGWYTVVSYGYGVSYAKPALSNPGNEHFSQTGEENAFYLMVIKECTGPKYNRPYKASVDTLTGLPYKIEWGPQPGHTSAYPITSKRYKLNRENFNCTEDTAYIKNYMRGCDTAYKKVVFYVFNVTKESYLQIDSIKLGCAASLYNFDVRTSDSVKLKTGTPLQSCFDKMGYLEYCKLQPGLYTLVVFATKNVSCDSLNPYVYVDRVDHSLFDHAAKAYDFGPLLPDRNFYYGKSGDVNPVDPNRHPSSDLFYCTTGAQPNDPANAQCQAVYNPHIYAPGNNIVLHPDTALPGAHNIDRRNLWYTFTLNNPGAVTVLVENKTLGKKRLVNGQPVYQYPFAVYKSDVDGTWPFSQVVSSGAVDSTVAQGLRFVGSNLTGGDSAVFCDAVPYIEFFVSPCDFVPTRYYIVVENRNPYDDFSPHDMNPNSQADVSVMLDPAVAKPVLFDHYSHANDLGLVNSGNKAGIKDNFTCATRDVPDPVAQQAGCNKTLWYKFTTTTTGFITYAASVQNVYRFDLDQIQLFRQTIPGDSTAAGLLHLPYTSTVRVGTAQWAKQCIIPGTYYIILPGCNAKNEDAFAEINITPQPGDFCSAPLVAVINGAGTSNAALRIDCHTIGTDYGEFNPTLTCPANGVTAQYKSSWFRLDIGGNDTLDVTVSLAEFTNAASTDIQYRLMTGNCGAMQEQSCVVDALTQNTYKCLKPNNSYYIQVLSPVSVNGVADTGRIALKVTAAAHTDTCLPFNNCIASAGFTTSFDCNKDQAVQFNNLSTFGSFISYDWDFGYNNQHSNAVSPQFVYPPLTTSQTYTVKLIVRNTNCGKADTISAQLTIPARPVVNLGRDTSLCNAGGSLALNAGSHPGAVYAWSTGSTQPAITVSSAGNSLVWVEVSYNNCKARDSIRVFISPIAAKPLQTFALCTASPITLNSVRGQGEKFRWNTGDTTGSINVSQPGFYWADLYLETCIVRDSFQVISAGAGPLHDTIVCQRNIPFTATATVNAATSYQWQNGSTSATQNITQPGLYWVDISLPGCTIRDSMQVRVDSFKTIALAATTCQGKPYTLPWGAVVNTAGIYRDSLRNRRGCDSIITAVTLSVTAATLRNVNASVCSGQSYTLPSGRRVNVAGLYADTLRNAGGCDSIVTSLTLSVVPNYTLKVSPDTAVCAGATLQLLAAGGQRYVWSGAGITNPTAASQLVKPASSLVYTVNAFAANDCFPQTASINITVLPMPAVEAGRDTFVVVGSSFTLLPVYGPNISTYNWTPADFLSCSNCPSPVVTPRRQVTYTITVSNALNCSVSDTRTIKLLCNNESVFVPNTFTPNGDGANDIFYPRGEGIKVVRYLRIFNRWGQLVFERLNFATNDRHAGWDGRFKGQLLDPDVFVYSMAIVCDNDEMIEVKGSVMIVR